MRLSAAFTKAFAVWEAEFRADPAKFMTADEMAATEVLPLSEQRTACFERILNTLAGDQPWESIA